MLLYKKLLLMTFGTTLVHTGRLCICTPDIAFGIFCQKNTQFIFGGKIKNIRFTAPQKAVYIIMLSFFGGGRGCGS